MSWETFIEENVREELIRLGFSVSVAQGGIPGGRPLQANVSGKPEGEDFR